LTGCETAEIRVFGEMSATGKFGKVSPPVILGLALRCLEQPPDCVFEAYRFEWSSTQQYHYMKDVVRTDCGGFWYGGGQVANQRWPLARDTNPFCQFLSADTLKVAQSSMERYWLNSNKLAIFVEDGVALWTEHWDGRLSLQAQVRDSCYENVMVKQSNGTQTELYDIHVKEWWRRDHVERLSFGSTSEPLFRGCECAG
uniref:C-type lectin domain-containing protein n=1 Tax=Anisakis simplex TaxID=6269 RepID=A0A0M3JB39_ANISI